MGRSSRPPREGREPSRRLSLVIWFRGTQRVAAVVQRGNHGGRIPHTVRLKPHGRALGDGDAERLGQHIKKLDGRALTFHRAEAWVRLYFSIIRCATLRPTSVSFRNSPQARWL